MLIEKIQEWKQKADSEKDAYNKYISVFIAYNILYNLYEKIKNPKADLTFGDRRRAVATFELIDSQRLFELIQTDLRNYIELIPVYTEEIWKEDERETPLSISIKDDFARGNKEEVVLNLLRWLYKVRCNLIHGDKGYRDKQHAKLLDESSRILDKILIHLLEKLSP